MDDFRTFVTDLRAGGRDLASDGHDLGAAQTTAAGAVSDAAGAVSGGLVAALGTFGARWAERCGEMVAAIEAAGATAGTNADRYESDDASAAASLGALEF